MKTIFTKLRNLVNNVRPDLVEFKHGSIWVNHEGEQVMFIQKVLKGDSTYIKCVSNDKDFKEEAIPYELPIQFFMNNFFKKYVQENSPPTKGKLTVSF